MLTHVRTAQPNLEHCRRPLNRLQVEFMFVTIATRAYKFAACMRFHCSHSVLVWILLAACLATKSMITLSKFYALCEKSHKRAICRVHKKLN